LDATLEAALFEFLREVNRRPEPFSEYTARELWTDPHTAQRMLDYHLDDALDAASRNRDFLDRSASWIAARFGLGPATAVADFGCGPGLYAQRYARTGAHVLAIDFSANSLRYAREAAMAEGLDIDYVEADYLRFETERRFDLITMIMCDFCALSPNQRATLLRQFCSMLAPGGSVLLDVYSPEMFESRQETATYAPDLLDGFWSPEEYFGFLTTFKYGEQRLLLDKYTIVEGDRTRRVFNWLQCFTLSELEDEFARSGLRVIERRGDVAGAAYDPGGTEFAVVAAEV
jgi:SAM-dependent methyltransferase